MAQLFSDVLSAPVSVGALAQMVTKSADATEPFTDATRELLRSADVVHFDETGGRAAGRLHWVHSASTSLLTLIDCHPKRGRAAMDDLGVIGAMSGGGHPRRVEALVDHRAGGPMCRSSLA
jgi:transposase